MSELAIKDLALAFGGNQVLDGVSFTVPKGSTFGIVGPNGAGKTSLLNCINGFYRPQRGVVLFEDSPISELRPPAIARRGVGRTFQNVELFRDATALDNIMLGRHMHMHANIVDAALYWGRGRRDERENRLVVERIIEFLEIEALRKRLVANIS